MRIVDADSLIIPREDVNSLVAIAYAPTIDAVPVVRCRECVHRDKRYEWHGDYNCRLHHEPKSLDFFCSDGERREEDGYCPYSKRREDGNNHEDNLKEMQND